jgi:CRISPR-associated protein Csx3
LFPFSIENARTFRRKEMVNTDATTGGIIIANTLPAILVGGPPCSGKSTLTYNLTRELQRCAIPHYVFRASAENEGNWFMEGNEDIVRQIQLRIRDYRHWTEIFRAFVGRDLANRCLPLIVDLGGLPQPEDDGIFRVCTHSILLHRDGKEDASRTWLHFTSTNGLTPLADLHSQQQGIELLTAEKPVITGTTTTGIKRGERMRGPVFRALVRSIGQLFLTFPPDELEKMHLDAAPVEHVVRLPHELRKLASDVPEIDEPDIRQCCQCLERESVDLRSDSDAWTADLLQPLLDRVAPTAMAVYGRAPAWVYGALALHAEAQPFYEFDARICWVTPPILQAGIPRPPSESLITIKTDSYNDEFIIFIHPIHNYLDCRDADKLVFPEPPPDHGVIVDGKLPLWLFTALARFYAQRNVDWIALNDARDNRPVVIYSKRPSHPIGRILSELRKL